VRPEIDLDDYDYELPAERIAQRPTAERDGARLLVLDRASGTRTHSHVRELPRWLRPGDELVVNATRVLPARLRGRKDSGGAAEALILGPQPGSAGRYRALIKTTGRLRTGLKLRFGSLDAELAERLDGGEVVLAFAADADPYAVGEMPLPPYIRREAARREDA